MLLKHVQASYLIWQEKSSIGIIQAWQHASNGSICSHSTSYWSLQRLFFLLLQPTKGPLQHVLQTFFKHPQAARQNIWFASWYIKKKCQRREEDDKPARHQQTKSDAGRPGNSRAQLAMLLQLLTRLWLPLLPLLPLWLWRSMQLLLCTQVEALLLLPRELPRLPWPRWGIPSL